MATAKRSSLARLSFNSAPLSDDDARLESLVNGLLWDTFVLNAAGDSYGLKWRYGTADAPREHIGGWLYDAHANKKTRGKLAFFILDDGLGMLRQCRDDSSTHTSRTIPFKDIVAVRATRSATSEMLFVKVYARKKGGDWLMTPVQSTSEDIVVRWTAALRHRAGLAPASFAADRARAERVALWAQSVVRMRQAVERAERRRARRRGLLSKLRGAAFGFEDTDSEPEEDGDEALDRVDAARRAELEAAGMPVPASPFLVTFVSALAADLYDNAFGGGSFSAEAAETAAAAARRATLRRSLFKPSAVLAKLTTRARRISGFDAAPAAAASGGAAAAAAAAAATKARAQPAGVASDEDGPLMLRNSSAVQDSFSVAPLQPYELEDELWENQRYGLHGLKSGWAREALLPTDRAAYSDRIGRGRWDEPASVPLPAGWELSTPWTLDVSGQVNGLCGEDGWTYGIDFPPLDSSLARGAPRIQVNVRSVVRHRRWFRRRVPEKRSRIETPVIWHGWLGRRSTGTGRWQSRYFVLTRGLRLHGKVTGIALSYFRAECADHLELAGTSDLDAWNQLTGRQLRTWNLDGAFVLGAQEGGRGSHRASKKRGGASANKGPFQFELRLATEATPVKLATMSAQLRDIWVAAVEFSVKDQVKRFTLTRSMELPNGAGVSAVVAETPQYANAILDRLLPMRVDEAVHMLFFDLTFRDSFFHRCGFTITREERWDHRKDPGSRRATEYRTPRRGGAYGGGFQVLHKEKLVRGEPGRGFQVDGSAQTPESPYGNIYQDEIRCVLTDWKGKMTRVMVSHQVNLRTEDEAVRLYVESSARGQVLTHYTEHWLPFVQKQLKRRRREERAQAATDMTIHSPTGIHYQVEGDSKAGGIRAVDPSYQY